MNLLTFGDGGGGAYQRSLLSEAAGEAQTCLSYFHINMHLPPFGDGGGGAYQRLLYNTHTANSFCRDMTGVRGGDEVPNGTGLFGLPLSRGSCRDMFGVGWG